MRISDWSSDVCSSDLKAERTAKAEADRKAAAKKAAEEKVAADKKAAAEKIAAAKKAAEAKKAKAEPARFWVQVAGGANERSEEHTSELQSLMRISYAVFCLQKKKKQKKRNNKHNLIT